MSPGGLYTGSEAYNIPDPSGVEDALKNGIFAFDTNVMLNLYRYNEQTVDEPVAESTL